MARLRPAAIKTLSVLGGGANRLLALAALIAPTIALGVWSWSAFLVRIDHALHDLTPVIAEEASRTLARPVRLRNLETDTSLRHVLEIFRHPERFGRLPIAIDGLEIDNRPDELARAGQSWLARVRRATAFVSIPDALAGRLNESGVPSVDIEGPELLLVRFPSSGPRGERFNLEDFAPPGKPDPNKKAFQTRITVTDGGVILRDFVTPLAKLPGQSPAENRFAGIGASATLGGERIAVRASIRAASGTPTARRFAGPIALDASIGAGAKQNGRYWARVDAAGIDLAYAVAYAAPIRDVRIERGVADAHATIAGAPGEQPVLTADARVSGGRIIPVRFATFAVDNATVDAHLDDGRATFTASANALGAPLSVTGELWDLPGLGGAPKTLTPSVYAKVATATLPLKQVLAALPRGSVPPDVTLGPRVTLTGFTVAGRVNDPAVSGRISDASVAYPGFPKVEQIAASVAYAGGVAVAEGVTAVSAGGRIAARGVYRVKEKRGRLSATLRDLDIRSVDAVRKIDDPKLRPSGRVSADIEGAISGKTVTATAKVRGDNLRVGALRFTASDATIGLRDKRVDVSLLQLASDAGVVKIAGSGVVNGPLNVTTHAVGLDLGQIGAALQLPVDLSGIASLSATVNGTARAPVVLLRDAIVLNGRVRSDNRVFAADVVRCERAQIALEPSSKRMKLALIAPLRASRYPAEATVSGELHGDWTNPTLALSATVENIDFDEVARQGLPVPARFAPRSIQSAAIYIDALRDLGWAEETRSPVSGVVTIATASVTGTLKKPVVRGEAQLGSLLLGPYPLEGGSLAFSVVDGAISVSDLRLTASVGEVKGSASLDADGRLAGHLEAPALRLDSLNRLTQKFAPLSGVAGIVVDISGTRDRPEIVAKIPDGAKIQVAGLPLEDVTASFRAPLVVTSGEPIGGRVTIESLAFTLAGARIAVEDGAVDLDNRSASGRLTVTGGRIAPLIAALRDAQVTDPALQESLARALRAESLPPQLDGNFTLTLNGRVRLNSQNEVAERSASASLNASDVRLGPTVTKLVSVRAQLDGDVVKVSELSAESIHPVGRDDEAEAATIRGSGTVQLARTEGEPMGLNFRVESNQAPVELVSAFSPSFPVRGKIDITTTVRGTTRDPNIQASIDGENLLIMEPSPLPDTAAVVPPITLATPAGLATEATLAIDTALALGPRVASANRGLTLDRVRAIGALRRDASSGLLQLVVQDALVRHGDDQVQFNGTVPYDEAKGRIAAERPLNLEARIERVDLASLAVSLGAEEWAPHGVLSGRATLTGTLSAPELGGELALTGGKLRFPRAVGDKRDPLNAIDSLEIAIGLSGKTITVKNARLALGDSPGRKRPGGSVSMSGSVTLENLEDITKPFIGDTAESKEASRLRGTYDLAVDFNGLSPDSENLSALLVSDVRGRGLGEAVRGKIDGRLTITGRLLRPSIKTATGAPLRLADAVYQFPRLQGPEPKPSAPSEFNPQFDVDVAIQKKALVQGQASILIYKFEGVGDVQVRGSLSEPRLVARIEPTGGVFQYVITQFTVQRGGEINVSFAGQRVAVDVRNVQAVGALTLSSLATAGARGGSSALSGGGLGNLASGTRVRITATLNGSLLGLGDESAVGSRAETDAMRIKNLVSFSSDKGLSSNEILSLLLVRSEFDRLAAGDSQQALESVVNQVARGLILPQLLNPLTQGVANSLGLDALTIDYSPDGTALFRATRRFPKPLDRFNLDLTRTVLTRGGAGQVVPYTYTLTYDLVQLRAAAKLQPQVLLGTSLNERRDIFYFLRGTIRY